jgi:hypothetical protein
MLQSTDGTNVQLRDLPTYKYHVGDQFVINSTVARVVECHATFMPDADPTTGVPAYYCTLANVSFPQLLPEAMLDGCLFGLRATENDDAKSSGSSGA